jgi:hypothetical protein
MTRTLREETPSLTFTGRLPSVLAAAHGRGSAPAGHTITVSFPRAFGLRRTVTVNRRAFAPAAEAFAAPPLTVALAMEAPPAVFSVEEEPAATVADADAGAVVPVCVDHAFVEPSPFVAVTRNHTLRFLSAVVSRYVEPVAPAMSTALVAVVNRCH